MCKFQNTPHSSLSIFYYFNLTNGMVAADRFWEPWQQIWSS